jgi:solute carrier family 25 protein 16
MVRIYPYAAVQYSSFELYKDLFGGFFLPGSLAGATAVCLTYPLDVVRGRLAVQTNANAGIISTLRTMGKEGKVLAGLGPALLGVVPFAGMKFLVFEREKALWTKWTGKSQRDISMGVRLVMGGLAGAAGQTAAFPLDVVRRRMQVVGLPNVGLHVEDYSGSTFNALVRIFRREGIRGWYRGILIDYVKVAPMVAISLSVFDWTKILSAKYLGVNLQKTKE